MAHFALMDGNLVIDVIVVANEAIDNLPFPESEPLGQTMLSASGFTGTYLQCSYNGNFRRAYPGTDWTYDSEADQFVPPGGWQPEPEPAA
jgi:hypothetical protein